MKDCAQFFWGIWISDWGSEKTLSGNAIGRCHYMHMDGTKTFNASSDIPLLIRTLWQPIILGGQHGHAFYRRTEETKCKKETFFIQIVQTCPGPWKRKWISVKGYGEWAGEWEAQDYLEAGRKYFSTLKINHSDTVWENIKASAHIVTRSRSQLAACPQCRPGLDHCQLCSASDPAKDNGL